jgi:hypothetical protein
MGGLISTATARILRSHSVFKRPGASPWRISHARTSTKWSTALPPSSTSAPARDHRRAPRHGEQGRRFRCQLKGFRDHERPALCCVVIVLTLGVPALARADAADGEQLARLWCAGFHVIGSGSPQSVQQGPLFVRSRERCLSTTFEHFLPSPMTRRRICRSPFRDG